MAEPPRPSSAEGRLGRIRPGRSRPRLAVHAVLFLATCSTTFVAGGLLGGSFDAGAGLAFAATLMVILVCHEAGHYVVARRHGVDASLPYFIPLPPGVSLGTMGAVIRMKDPIADRAALLDVGAAGPLAGLAVAVPLLAVGLALSPVGPSSGGVVEGNSLLYLALKLAVHGRVLPTAEGIDVQLHPIGFAAWVGLLITFVNLIPIGQLDGGHVAASVLGDRHEGLSRRLHGALLAVGLGVFGWLALDAMGGGMEVGAAASYAGQAAMPWLVWAALLVVLRRASGDRYHPPAGGPPLGPGRRRLAALVAVVFVAIFTPVPLREVLVPLLADVGVVGAPR